MSFRDALATMWHVDLAILIEELKPDWTNTDENLARLVDRLDYELQANYARATTDPNDPDVKREREARRRAGHKPPPLPIIRPVAVRPQALHSLLLEQTQALIEQHEKPKQKKMTLAELREMRARNGR